jgi:hypothetical protein
MQQRTQFPVQAGPGGELLQLVRGAGGDVPLDPGVPEQCVCAPETEIGGPAGGVRHRRPDVRADQFERDQGRRPALDLLPFDRVVGVRGPHPVGAFQDAEVDPGPAGEQDSISSRDAGARNSSSSR